MPRITVLVAADLYKSKVNLELSFPSYPSITDLQRLVETTFAVESSAMRPPGHPFVPFKASRFQIFDDRLQQWVDLVSPNQLVDFCQVYAFQGDREIQGQIPPARLPSAAGRSSIAPVPSSPPRNYSPSRASITPAARGTSPIRGYAGASSLSVASPARPSVAAPLNTSTGLNASAASLAAPVAPAPLPPPTRQFPDGASYDSKARVVFDELDINGNRVIENEEFRRAFRTLNIDLTSATVGDLFARGDRDRDGVLSLSELQSWGSNYPTLLDALYFRSKEFWLDNAKKQQLEAQSNQVNDAKDKEAQAQALLNDAKNDLATQEAKLSAQEAEVQARIAKERDSRQDTLDAKKETEKAQYDRQERERDLAGGRERERQQNAGVVESQRLVEATQRRVAAQEGELSRAQEKERQLEALLAEARRETERQLKNVQMVNDELAGNRNREQGALQAFADAQRDVQRLQEIVSNADLELARRIERERETEQFLSEAQREAARAAHRRDEEERELQIQRERELHHTRLAQDASRNVEDTTRILQGMEADYADNQARRQQVEAQELPLLEQEIRLREQRYSLEERETQLASETTSFRSTTGRTPGRSELTSVSAINNSSYAATSPVPLNSSLRRAESPRRSPERRR